MGLMFPKEGEKKKRKKHGTSLLHSRDGTCYICREWNGCYMQQEGLQKHHIFGGPNRDLAEEDGLFMWLCIGHHTGSSQAVHTNKEIRDWTHRIGQKAYEDSKVSKGWTKNEARETFMRRYGRNYL
jgi:hypothetical protein